MPNIASVLKAEISRLARKEVREENDSLKKHVAAQRTEIAGLKRRLQALEAAVKRLGKGPRASGGQPAADVKTARQTGASALRFRAQGMAANRKRLGLSAADFALLIGTTGQSVYAWEAGKAKPRPDALAAIASLRGIGKREVLEKLASLQGR